MPDHNQKVKAEPRDIRPALGARKYDQAFRICENIRRSKGNKTPSSVIYLGTCALFGLGHIHQARDWVEEYARRFGENADYQYLKAYIHLHARNFEEALLCWTRILELDPSRTLADSLIEKMRAGESGVFRELQEDEAFRDFVPLEKESQGGRKPQPPTPAPRRPGLGKKVIIITLLLILIGGGLGVGAYYLPQTRNYFQASQEELKGKLPVAPSSGAVVPAEQLGEDRPEIIYKNLDDVLIDFKNAREMIIDGRINQARYLLARIQYSNASFNVKERAGLLRESIPRTNAALFRDPVTPEQIAQEALLYRHAVILWQGRAGDIYRTTGLLRFSLKEESCETCDVRVLATSETLRAFDRISTDLKPNQKVQVFGEFMKLDEGAIFIKAREIR